MTSRIKTRRWRALPVLALGLVASGTVWTIGPGLIASAGSCSLNSSFGRMFPDLQPASWPIGSLAKLADKTMEDSHFQPPSGTPSDEVSNLPAGFNYTGQFLDHDITLDNRPNDLLTPIAVSALKNARSPMLDLDSLYGNGPSGSPSFYESDGLHFKLGELLTGAESDHNARDLLRGSSGVALIADARNDENQIVASLHSIFTRFHNRVIDDVRKRNPSLSNSQAFDQARTYVRNSYQWALLTDFLPRMAGSDVVSSVVSRSSAGWSTNLRYYNPCNGTMPIEFAMASYRFGHSLVRNDYEINEIHNDLPVFTSSFSASDSLVGFQPTPKDHAIDWKYFFNLRSDTSPQNVYQFDNSLVPALKKLPGPEAGTQSTVLATRNILRGQQVGLPTGQDVARAMGQTPLRDDQILIGPALGSSNHTTQAITSISSDFAGKAPLWTYILGEAAFYNHNGQVSNGSIQTDSRRDPERLGPVGARIVTETFVGLLKNDPTSILNNPWTPDRRYESESDQFRFSDVVKVATGLSPAQSNQVNHSDGYIDFGSSFWFNIPKANAVWLTNTTQAPVRYGAMSLSGANAGNFRVSFNGCGGIAWLPGTSCMITVNFAGDSAQKTARLEVATDGVGPVILDMKGNAPRPLGATGEVMTPAPPKVAPTGNLWTNLWSWMFRM